MARSHRCCCLVALVVSVLGVCAVGQTIENKTPLTPEVGEAFGYATARGPLISPPSGDWVVVGVPRLTVSGVANVGNVECFPVMNTPTVVPFSIVPPAAYVQSGMRFGESVAAADVDNDGIVDIIVGAPGYDNGTRLDEGVVIIFQNPSNPFRAASNHYGWAVEIGQFSNPQEEDLPDIAVGIPDQERPVGGGGILQDAGLVQVHYGHFVLGVPTWDNTPGFFQEAGGTLYNELGRQGTALAAADYTGDAWDDLAVGSPGAVDAQDNPLGPEGFVMIYDGTPSSGLASAGSMNEPIIRAPSRYQSSTNMFGYSLDWADTDGGGQLDLVIGAPGVTNTPYTR
ncbi:MAG: FG-GAP repeat protein [Planctomycetota bacterium]